MMTASAFVAQLPLLQKSSLFRTSVQLAASAEPPSSSSPQTKQMTQTNKNDNNVILSLTLEKPLGLMLEECAFIEGKNENAAVAGGSGGVFVKDIGETGSAVAYADQIRGAKLLTVGGVNVASADFDTVMELIVGASASVTIEFSLLVEPKKAAVEFAVGTPVVITLVVDAGGKNPNLELNAAVGDNLRQVLLDNGVEVYQGLKQKLGNCGGAGQCTFCAVDFLESEGWAERSDYEDGKLKRFPTARLACLNNIQGPATIRKTQR